MKELFADAERGLADARIDESEREQGSSFPEDFKQYLREINGGWLRDSADFQFGEGHVTAARCLLGFNPSSKRDIGKKQANMDYVPPQLLPIGEDLGGADVFVLDLRPETLGRVYIRAINVPPNPKPFLPASLFVEPDEEALYHHVADSFSEFIDMIAGRARS
ncbi:SMI1/KNR4 family protein [Vitreimonas flagellata]|uniref:SMI1/KNR4 family protein n=1 Tax=Vitreimonas flagellata TaxID=2560861 RepID=UPI0010750452|nr:SMI1/KNR4 family protein [Vitreimonas flagellata]